MKFIFSLFVILLLLSSLSLAQEKAIQNFDMFPYCRETYCLPNGMEVVLIKCGNDGTVMDLLVVDAGGRNEKKPDEMEYTHLMEHLMFRGSKNYSVDRVNEIYTKYGIYEQGFTESDFTCYYRIFPREALEDLVKIMTDKLVNLQLTPEEYKAETGAVIGEYQGHWQKPWSKLSSKLYQIAFSVHPYRDVPNHLEILKKMPQNEDSVMNFYRNYYKPNNCRLIIVGDFDKEKAKEIIEKNYGKLKPGKILPEIPQEPPQTKEITGEVKFPGKTSPYIIIAYKIPAYDLNNIEIPSIDLIKELYFTQASPLYKRLVYDEKLVSSIYFPGYYFSKDPALFNTELKLKHPEDIEKVKKIFLEEVDRIKQNLCDEKKLEEIKEKTRYDMLTGMGSLEKIGFTFFKYYILSYNPDGVDLYFKNYYKVSPTDIKKTAEKYFTENNRTVVTLIEESKGEKKNE